MGNDFSAKRVLAVAVYVAITASAWVLGLADLRPRAGLLPADGVGRLPVETIEKHIGRIALRPHSVGTPEHDRVRDYILSELTGAGLAPSVQQVTTVWDA